MPLWLALESSHPHRYISPPVDWVDPPVFTSSLIRPVNPLVGPLPLFPHKDSLVDSLCHLPQDNLLTVGCTISVYKASLGLSLSLLVECIHQCDTLLYLLNRHNVVGSLVG